MEPCDTPHEISLNEDEMSFIKYKLMPIRKIFPEPVQDTPPQIWLQWTQKVLDEDLAGIPPGANGNAIHRHC